MMATGPPSHVRTCLFMGVSFADSLEPASPTVAWAPASLHTVRQNRGLGTREPPIRGPDTTGPSHIGSARAPHARPAARAPMEASMRAVIISFALALASHSVLA